MSGVANSLVNSVQTGHALRSVPNMRWWTTDPQAVAEALGQCGLPVLLLEDVLLLNPDHGQPPTLRVQSIPPHMGRQD